MRFSNSAGQFGTLPRRSLQWDVDSVEPGQGRRFRPAWHGTAAGVLAVVFTAVAAGCLVLVALDHMIGRPAAEDHYLAGLNAVAAGDFRRWRSRP